MLAGVLIGQRTPGHSLREADAFERRIHQRYVDFIRPAGWEYLGVYSVEGLVPGAFGEVMLAENDDLGALLRRDRENEAELPADVGAIYAECRLLFWQRGSIRFWVRPPPGWTAPRRGEAVRITVGAGFAALPWSGVGEPAVEAALIEPLGPRPLAPLSDEPLPAGVAPLPDVLAAGTVITFAPLVPAPEPSATD